MKIFISGSDNIGWSIDQDYKNIERYINKSNNKKVDKWWKADIIHNVWWNILVKDEFKYMRLFHKRIAVTCSNFIDINDPHYDKIEEFNKIKKVAKIWIVPSHKQEELLKNFGCKTFYFPFSINKSIFKYSDFTKKAICSKHGLDYNLLKKKIVIGSFQRDSLGKDISKPKWQKNPQLLIDLIKELPKEKYILLLVGARRHYLLNECKKYGIPYIYAGIEQRGDDLKINSKKIDEMPDFYNLTDIYLITSKSEGGPKAAIEATAMKTFVMATDVGLCKDFIANSCVFNDKNKYSSELKRIIDEFPSEEIEEIIKQNYERNMSILNENTMVERIQNLYNVIK